MADGTWTEVVATTPPTARKYGGLTYDPENNLVLLFGGNDGSTPLLNDTWHYNPSTMIWSQLSPVTSPSARQGHACCATDEYAYIFGGDDGDYKYDTWRYVSGDWEEVTGSESYPDPRAYPAMAQSPLSTGGVFKIFMWGGDTGADFDNQLWTLNTNSDSWQATETFLTPTPRMKHSMYYDPDRNSIIMFGGVSIPDGIPLNDLWEYDGVEWTPLTTQQRPHSRQAWQGMAYDTILHRAVLAPTGIGATGSITTVEGQYHVTGDTFTLDDGSNPETTFEVVPVVVPTDVIMQGGVPTTGLRFDLTSLFVTETDLDASTDHSGTSIYIRCKLSDFTATVVSTYAASVNYADVGNLLGQTSPFLSTQPGDYLVGIAPTGGNVLIEAELTDTRNDMRDKVADAINSVALLDIVAYAYGLATVNLFNSRADTIGNATSSVSMTRTGFSVSDMTGATADSWAYTRSGGRWVEQTGADHAPLRDGAMFAYDQNANAFVLFGGEEDTVLKNTQYEWTWDDLAIPVLHPQPGTWQARIQPTYGQATDGSWAYVLGSDQENLPEFLVNTNDEVRLWQECDITDEKLLRFDWKMRYSTDIPRYAKLIDAGVSPMNVSFRTSGLLTPSAGSPDNVYGIRLAQPLLTANHAEQICKISGATEANNNGVFRISAVPSNIGEVSAWGGAGALQAGMVAVIENAAMVHSLDDPGVTLEIYGAEWVARMYINDGVTERLAAELIESRVNADPDGWQRSSLAANVSKISGTVTVIFVLRLISSSSTI